MILIFISGTLIAAAGYAWLDPDNLENTFLGDYSSICQNYLVKDYLKDVAPYQIEKTIHVQAGYDASFSEQETAWLERISTVYKHPCAAVIYADLTNPNLDSVLEMQCQFKMTRGVRQIVNWHANPYYAGCSKDFLADLNWFEGFKKLADYNLSFDLQLYPHQMEAFYQFIKQIDTIPIIIDHCGMPLTQDDENLTQWRIQLKKLAVLPYCYIKLSGLGMFGYFGHNRANTIARNIIQECIDMFGVERCLFGSNFPVEKLYITYDDLIQFFMKALAGCSNSERYKLFYQNAKHVYRLYS